MSPFYCHVISCISFELPSRVEKDGDGMKLLAPRMSELWPFLGRDVHKKKETTFYVLIASSRQLVLSDSLTMNAIGNRISQRIIQR